MRDLSERGAGGTQGSARIDLAKFNRTAGEKFNLILLQTPENFSLFEPRSHYRHRPRTPPWPSNKMTEHGSTDETTDSSRELTWRRSKDGYNIGSRRSHTRVRRSHSAWAGSSAECTGRCDPLTALQIRNTTQK